MDNRKYNNDGNNNRNGGNNNRNGNNKNGNNKKSPKSGILICLILSISVFMGFSFMVTRINSLRNVEIGYNDL